MVLSILFLTGLGYVIIDLGKHPDETDNSKNTAILGEFVSSTENYKVVETEFYSMKIPEGWIEVNRPQIIENGISYYPDRYQGVTSEEVGRWIDVYRNDIPDLAVDKLQKIEPNGASVKVGNLSGQCVGFTELVVPGQNEATRTTWDGVNFLCSMTQSANMIISGWTDAREGVDLIGDKTDGSYMFMFADHGSREDNTIFQKILASFRVK